MAERIADRIRALYAGLAAALGLPALAPDANGGIELTVGGDTSVVLFGEGDATLLAVVPVAPLPPAPDQATVLWLLRRNLYDSGIAPFTLACDAGGTLVLWGRLPLDGLTGPRLAGLLDALAGEAATIRRQIAEE